MEPMTGRLDHSQERPDDDALSPLTVHDLQASLTVIKAQAQMLRRWARRQELADGEAVSARLAMIDDTATRLSMEIYGLRRSGKSDVSPGEPEGR